MPLSSNTNDRKRKKNSTPRKRKNRRNDDISEDEDDEDEDRRQNQNLQRNSQHGPAPQQSITIDQQLQQAMLQQLLQGQLSQLLSNVNGNAHGNGAVDPNALLSSYASLAVLLQQNKFGEQIYTQQTGTQQQAQNHLAVHQIGVPQQQSSTTFEGDNDEDAKFEVPSQKRHRFAS